MTKFWKIAWRSSVSGAAVAIAFWAAAGRIQAPTITPSVTLFPAVLTPREARPWMRAPMSVPQPNWIGDPQ